MEMPIFHLLSEFKFQEFEYILFMAVFSEPRTVPGIEQVLKKSFSE